MKKIIRAPALPDELVVAIGLIWGYLNVGQFEHADSLLKGCLRVWPNDQNLLLMAAHVSIELSRPLDVVTTEVLKGAACRDWTSVAFKRAALSLDSKAN